MTAEADFQENERRRLRELAGMLHFCGRTPREIGLACNLDKRTILRALKARPINSTSQARIEYYIKTIYRNQPPMDNRKIHLIEAERTIREALGRLPEWAGPIVEKHLARYMSATAKVCEAATPQEFAKAMAAFQPEAVKIVRDMYGDIQKEAERHGYPLTAAIVRKARQDAGRTPTPADKKRMS